MKDHILEKLKQYGQFHIIEHLKSLTEEEHKSFLNTLTTLDMDLVFNLFNQYKREKKGQDVLNILPAKVITLPVTDKEKIYRERARQIGERLLRENRVAVLIVAGGQGTRLGFEGPKGTFPISPIKGKSFFQLFSEQIKALSKKYSARIPLIIMTSEENDNETRSFFKENHFFSLKEDEVLFFKQGMLPSLTLSGELVLKGRYELATNPDGHGGSLKAIYESGILKRLISNGFTELFYCQVDNPLVKIADPVFLGYHSLEGAEVSTKVVRRRSIDEKVGVYVSVNGKDAIIEYSDMDKKYMEAVDEKGDIVYWAGNTAIHVFSLYFIERLNNHGFVLPYHRAKKKLEIKTDGNANETDVLKFETFVFDAIPFAKKACAVEVIREEEFSPVKNREGIDSPETAHKDMCMMFKRWLESAGAKVKPDINVEISPLFALECTDFVKKFNATNMVIEQDIYLGE
ncbi:MAG: UTP--glucose-1-phosphate uridylyltransferase [Syntrophorhabdaceae bacterium]|nr:UTP--glucose-1-phosphate uridylyltransferase [Syntrophorhabdaceae bacterium]